MKKEAYEHLDPVSREQMRWIDLNNRTISLQSQLDMASENYKTLQEENKVLRTGQEKLKDRVKYNHNDIAGLTENIIDLEKDIEDLKKREDSKSFWKTLFKR